ncbi:C2 family cysteine protease [Methylocapsa sp. S129]|uniref:C2 family cysteine protease n=1 Tax=Methylocapsa sp. S129 TaxID=1641869 RepID=UPI00131D6544|nr:C2 family cysteine protease [Methylocapsa sp. S129]
MWMRGLISLSGAAFIAFGCVASARASGGLSDNAQAFLATVRSNFAAWDTSHKGRLTLAEIEADMQNPAIKGDAAAALAALMWGAKPSKAEPEPRSYALTDFDAIEKTLLDGQKPDRSYIATFAEGRRKVAAERRELFADKEPHLDAIRQQKDSDCYFNSAVGAIAKERPQIIVKMIRENKDGSFTVTFPGHAAEKIPAPTDAEIAAYTDSSDGLWFNVLEKAYGEIRKINPKAVTDEPLDAAALHGGSTSEIMTLLTGHNTRNILFPIKTGHPADNKLFNQIRTEVSAALDAHMAVTTGKVAHAYAVVAYDGATDMFTLHNPYDRGGQEKMPDGDGAARDEKGFFTMTTAKFVENFNNVVIEEMTTASR